MEKSPLNMNAIVSLGIGAAFVGSMFGILGFNTVTLVHPDRQDSPETSPVPEDFALTYSYGPGLAYSLTVDNTGYASFDVEMCHAVLPVHATTLMLRQEVEEIWKSVENNYLFEITEDFTKECSDFGRCIVIHPANRIILEVQADGKVKTIEFHQNYALNHSNEQLRRFNEVVGTIDGILEEGYKDLPRTDCRYL